MDFDKIIEYLESCKQEYDEARDDEWTIRDAKRKNDIIEEAINLFKYAPNNL